MGTCSTITARMSDGTYVLIYCHWDSYPSHNGRILQEYYSTQSRIEALIALGDLSFLRESPLPPPENHNYRSPAADYCIAYGRDRGESGTEARRGMVPADCCSREEYNYLWNGQAWSVNGTPLAEVLAESEKD